MVKLFYYISNVCDIKYANYFKGFGTPCAYPILYLSMVVLVSWFLLFTTCCELFLRYHGHPRGWFSIDPDLQSIIVLNGSLQRQLVINVTRSDGPYGRVRVDFTLRYNQVNSVFEILLFKS